MSVHAETHTHEEDHGHHHKETFVTNIFLAKIIK